MGAGPNGLAAALAVARAGRDVTVYEAAETVGGGCRTAELTLPGIRHDVCAAIHPFGPVSPAFRGLPIRWLAPEVALAHPLDDGSAAVLRRSLDETVAGLGADGPAYRGLVGPLAADARGLMAELMRPVLRFPRRPALLARLALPGLLPASLLARAFPTERGRALLAGLAAHSVLPLDRALTSAYALTLAVLAHETGWPVAEGGSQSVVDAMAAAIEESGGRIVTGTRVSRIADLPEDRVLADVSPRRLAEMAPLPRRYARHRYGPGAFKLDLALSEPVPWRAPECRAAGTVHVGGSFAEVAAAEEAVARGRVPDRPFVLVAQQAVADPSRGQALWAYTHVPPGCEVDMTERIEAQVERFAPGFRDTVLARRARGPAALEAYDENYVGGDITGGVPDLRRALLGPGYATPDPRLWLCSSSAPPGAGVHGMCGLLAARAALQAESRSHRKLRPVTGWSPP